MKFVHMADMHFDIPFTVLNNRNKLGEKRRLEQREAFKKIIDFIKTNNVEYFFIAGDLYENEYIRQTTIEYINNLFKEIPNTKIYIAPGNHDPYIKSSMYNTFKWNDNVHIFNDKIELLENSDCDIYGYGFSDFYCKNSGIENLQIKNKDKINILLMHGSLNGGTAQDMEYNPLNKLQLKELGLDYIALGHIHKLDYNTEENQRIVYPGSTISMGFDELGKHGVIYGELDKENINLKFVPIDNKEFKEIELDISDINSQEELIEKINGLLLDENKFYKIILVGKRNFEIDLLQLNKFILLENIIKIKDKTILNYNLKELINNTTLKGIFAQELLNELENKNYSEEEINKILEIGLEALD